MDYSMLFEVVHIWKAALPCDDGIQSSHWPIDLNTQISSITVFDQQQRNFYN